MTGMNRYGDKQKRAMRRRNHIARDLKTKKYRQRVRESRHKDKYPISWENEDEAD